VSQCERQLVEVVVERVIEPIDCPCDAVISPTVQETRVVEQLIPGPPGGGGGQQFWTAENATGAPIQPGQAVRVAAGGVAQLASAADNTAPVAGLAVATVAPSVSGDYQTAGHLTLADWTAAAGASGLTPGATYWLSATPGQLTTTPPAGSGRSLQRVGQALSASTLAIQITRYARRA